MFTHPFPLMTRLATALARRRGPEPPLPSWHAARLLSDHEARSGGRHRRSEDAEPTNPDVERPALRRLKALVDSDHGMSTSEYAVGTIAAAALAALLYVVVTGDTVLDALTELIERALRVEF